MPRRARKGCTYETYIPDELTALDLTLSGAVAADVADAEHAIASVPGGGTQLTTVEALSRFLLRVEAVASSRIEGLEVGPRRLARAEIAARQGWPIDDRTAADVVGNVAAVRQAIAQGMAGDELEVDDLHDLHRTLLSGERPFAVGAARTTQNWIGGSAHNPCGAAFVPPPADRVGALLADLMAYVNSDVHSPAVQAALAHAQFETVHPYADGNGRVGRALIHVVLTRRGLAAGALLPISLALATRQDEYVAGLTTYRFTGAPDSPDGQAAMNAWIEMFAAACIRAVDDVRWLLMQYNALIDGYRAKLGPVRRDSTIAELLARLGELPVLSVELASEHLDRSFEATNNAVGRLVDVGALRQATIGRRNRIFEATDILQLVTSAERRIASRDADTQASPPVRRVPRRPI